MSSLEEIMFKKNLAKSFIIEVLKSVVKNIKNEEQKKEILFQTERIQKFLKGYPWGTTTRRKK